MTKKYVQSEINADESPSPQDVPSDGKPIVSELRRRIELMKATGFPAVPASGSFSDASLRRAQRNKDISL